MQDQYYNVRGPAFVIPRVEEREMDQAGCAHRAKFVRAKKVPARRAQPQPCPSSLSLIHQAVAQNPMGLTVVSDGPLVDVDVEGAPEAGALESATMATPAAEAMAQAGAVEQSTQPSTCTGIVHVPTSSVDPEGDSDLFQTSSSSPRRTKMLRFTCLANGCRAVNVKPISPGAFATGTVFAQCAKCGKWRLIRDHLNLWDQTRRPVYRNGRRVKPVGLEDIPEALRPAPEDLEFFLNHGSVAGWEGRE